MSEKLALLKKKIEALREEEDRLTDAVREEEKQILLNRLNINPPQKLSRVEFSKGNTSSGPLCVSQYFLEGCSVSKYHPGVLYLWYTSEDSEDGLALEAYSDACLINFMKEHRLFLSPKEAIANAVKEMRESLSEQ